jgi:hypothetical protein
MKKASIMFLYHVMFHSDFKELQTLRSDEHLYQNKKVIFK